MIKAWGLPTFPVSFWQTLSKTFTLVTTTDFISRKQHQSAVMSSSQERALQPVTFLASARLTQFLKCQAAEITPAADVRRRWAGFTQSSWATHSYTQLHTAFGSSSSSSDASHIRAARVALELSGALQHCVTMPCACGRARALTEPAEARRSGWTWDADQTAPTPGSTMFR